MDHSDMLLTVNDPSLNLGLFDSQSLGDGPVFELTGLALGAKSNKGNKSKFSQDRLGSEPRNTCL